MKHVASDPKTQALKLLQPQPPRTAPGRASAKPFESLLEGASPVRDTRTARSSSSGQDTRPERADRTNATNTSKPGAKDQPDRPKLASDKSASSDSANAKSADAKSSDSKTGDNQTTNAAANDPAKSEDAKADKTDKTASDSVALADGKAAADAKALQVAAGITDTTPVTESQPAGGALASALATAAPLDTQVADTTTELVPAAAALSAAAQTAPAAAQGEIAAKLTTAKPGAIAARASDKTSKDESALEAKPAPEPLDDGKPQTVTADADANANADADAGKKANAHARGEAAGKDNRVTVSLATAASAGDTFAAAPKAGAEHIPLAIMNASSYNTAAAAAQLKAALQLPPQSAPIPLAGVALEITSRALSNTKYFEIRLDPPELGRIEVRLAIDSDGNVTSRLIADRTDTLDLLRRDASGLDRALQDAGLKTGGNSLQFSLRDQPGGQEQAAAGADTSQRAAEDDMLASLEAIPFDYRRLAGHGSGLDIRV